MQLDIAQHDDVVIARDFVESTRQHLHRALAIAAEELVIGAGHALWRIAQALAIGVVAGIGDERAHGLFGLLAGGPDNIGPAADLGRRGCGPQLLYRSIHDRSLGQTRKMAARSVLKVGIV